MSDEPDWRDVAIAYTERIHHLERIAIADQQSYRALQVENENLKHRLSMAESDNPDSVLSKHNALLMACKARDEAQEQLEQADKSLVKMLHDIGALQAELERRTAWSNEQIHQLEAQLDVHVDTVAKLRAELEQLKHDHSWALGTAQEEKQIAESERDTARAEVEATHKANTVQLKRLQANRADISALQAKVARAVALLEDVNRYEQMMPVGIAKAALEALR